MPNMSEAFPSKYLAAEDLKGQDHVVTIDRFQTEIMKNRDGAEEQKYVLFLRGAKKGWVLNKTNGKAIAAQHGSELNDWIGKQITIGATYVESFGDTVLAIRVRPALAQGAADAFAPAGPNGNAPATRAADTPLGQPSTETPTEPFTDQNVANDPDDSIPF